MSSSDRPTAVVETHLSRVFLTPDRVYKLLKSVQTSFVDFTDPAIRLAAADTEYRLNKAISPDVYLGTADIEEEGEVTDRMIVMRRLPADRQLDHLIDDPQFFTHLREVARLVATYHAGQPPVSLPSAEPATATTLSGNWADNFAALEPLAGSLVPLEDHHRARQLVEDYLSGREQLFDTRIADGWVRDGHGDLRCEHVFCLDDGPRLIDCLAFRDQYRVADVLNDVAFLAMDLQRLAGPAAAKYFIERYDEFSGELHPASLAHHYVAYRAMVRAKVAAIRFGQGEVDAGDDVVAYHRLALEHLELGQVRLILVGGSPGVGKSTVAGGLSQRLAANWLRADEVRKDLAGMDHREHAFEQPDSGLYSPEFSDQVYRHLLDQAEMLLNRGESVILDASWSTEPHRRQAEELADRTSAGLTQLRCVAPLSVASERIARRMASIDDPSDATPEIARHVAARFAPWPEAATVDTARTVADAIEEAYCQVMIAAPTASVDDRDSSSSDSEVMERPVQLSAAVLSYETVGFFLARMSGYQRRPDTPSRMG